MSILIQSREPAAPPLPVPVVRAWDVRCPRTSAIIKDAVVLEHTPHGYAATGPLLSIDPFHAGYLLSAVTRGRAIREAKDLVAAKLIPWAENIMALSNAFAARDAEDDEVDDDDDSTLELDQAEVAAAMAVALGELRVAYPAGV